MGSNPTLSASLFIPIISNVLKFHLLFHFTKRLARRYGSPVGIEFFREALSTPGSILIVFVIAQIGLMFVGTHEDQELDKLRTEVSDLRREEDLLRRIKLSQLQAALAANAETITRIRAGDLAGAKEWKGFS